MSKHIKPDLGLFVVKGDTLSTSEFTISKDEQGNIETSPITLTSGIDMTPFWLSIAFQHMKSTEKWHKKLMLAKNVGDDNEIGRCLKKESYYGMQSIVASGIAIDAYYASIKKQSKYKLSKSKAARYKQVSEIIRCAFKLKEKTFKVVRNNIEQIYSWRDAAVHPEAGTSEPKLHVELNKITDWRYATFRYFNVREIYSAAFSIVYVTASNPPSKKYKDLHNYCSGLTKRLLPLLKSWEAKNGKLFQWLPD